MPRLLDLFCGAGGAAVGYSRAGFTEIVGVDCAPQPHYPFTFVQADALEYLAGHGQEFDAIHASPPCQYYSPLRHLPRAGIYEDSVPPTQVLLRNSGKPFVLENVMGAKLQAGWLCGGCLVCLLNVIEHLRPTFSGCNQGIQNVPGAIQFYCATGQMAKLILCP